MTFAFFTGLAAGILHVFSGPDHLAAVAPLAVDRSRNQWSVGLQWGAGHTAGVLIIAAALLVLRERLPLEAIAAYSERIVGVALIAVGLWGIRSACVPRGASVHTHARKSFAFGTLHGLAGSSHLFGVLPALAFAVRADAVVYLAGFGIGAIVAMAVFAAGVGLVAIRFGQFKGLLYASSATALVIGGVWLVGR
ncbi:MAG: High-affinity nickel transporter [Cyanobacteria bacterium]|nr:High-affinity nickel transporter [Cyanobacteriota bacterium]